MRRAATWLLHRWEEAAALVLLAASLVAFVKLTLFIDRPVVDDALISIAFGRSLVDGDGLRLTAHSHVVEGFSNPTWTRSLTLNATRSS